jgi:hypothetical protein
MGNGGGRAVEAGQPQQGEGAAGEGTTSAQGEASADADMRVYANLLLLLLISNSDHPDLPLLLGTPFPAVSLLFLGGLLARLWPRAGELTFRATPHSRQRPAAGAGLRTFRLPRRLWRPPPPSLPHQEGAGTASLQSHGCPRCSTHCVSCACCVCRVRCAHRSCCCCGKACCMAGAALLRSAAERRRSDDAAGCPRWDPSTSRAAPPTCRPSAKTSHSSASACAHHFPDPPRNLASSAWLTRCVPQVPHPLGHAGLGLLERGHACCALAPSRPL